MAYLEIIVGIGGGRRERLRHALRDLGSPPPSEYVPTTYLRSLC